MIFAPSYGAECGNAPIVATRLRTPKRRGFYFPKLLDMERTPNRHRPGRVARLKTKLAKVNRENEQLRRQIELLQFENANYKEQNAVLFLMTDTQNNRITKLIGMLERLTVKNP